MLLMICNRKGENPVDQSSRDVNRGAWALQRAGLLREAVAQWSELAVKLREEGEWAEARGIGRTLLWLTEGADARLRAVALYVMAEASRAGGELGEAEKWIRQALAMHEASGDVRGAASDWVSRGELAEEGADLEDAVGCWGRALALLDSERSGEAMHEVLLDLGRAYSQLGQIERASECAERAEALAARWAAESVRAGVCAPPAGVESAQALSRGALQGAE
jgi:tetratricopeptide (TPR) repeat protein